LIYMQPKMPVNLEDFISGSKYFKWKEALWLPKVQAYAVPSVFQQENIVAQARALDKVRERFGAMIIHSWLRPNLYNDLIVGGAKESSHELGMATDFSCLSYSCDEVKKLIMADPDLYAGRGEIDTTNWVHLDLKPGPWFYARKRPS
jgi:hypothetical protein